MNSPRTAAAPYGAPKQAPNSRGDGSGTRKGRYRHLKGPTAAVMRAAHETFQPKANAQVAAIAGVSHRQVKRWKAGRAEMALPQFQRLLNERHGFASLAAVMRGSNQVWWKLVCTLMALADARSLQAKANDKIKTVLSEAADADRDISRALSRAEALLIQDSDFYGRDVADFRAVGGLQGGAVASKKVTSRD